MAILLFMLLVAIVLRVLFSVVFGTEGELELLALPPAFLCILFLGLEEASLDDSFRLGIRSLDIPGGLDAVLIALDSSAIVARCTLSVSVMSNEKESKYMNRVRIR